MQILAFKTYVCVFSPSTGWIRIKINAKRSSNSLNRSRTHTDAKLWSTNPDFSIRSIQERRPNHTKYDKHIYVLYILTTITRNEQRKILSKEKKKKQIVYVNNSTIKYPHIFIYICMYNKSKFINHKLLTQLSWKSQRGAFFFMFITKLWTFMIICIFKWNKNTHTPISCT